MDEDLSQQHQLSAPTITAASAVQSESRSLSWSAILTQQVYAAMVGPLSQYENLCFKSLCLVNRFVTPSRE